MKKTKEERKVIFAQGVVDFLGDKYSSTDIRRLGNLMGIQEKKYLLNQFTLEELAGKFVDAVYHKNAFGEMLNILQKDEDLDRETVPELVKEWNEICRMPDDPAGENVKKPVIEMENYFQSRASEVKRTIIETTSEAGIHLKDHLTAIVIGVEEYLIGNGENNLPGAVKDAKELSSFLEYNWNLPKEKIHLFTGKVCRNQLLAELRDICSTLTETDKLLFYFAGHSYGDDKHAYLVLSDSVKTGKTVNKTIPLSEINEIIRNCKAEIKFRIFDSMLYGKKVTRAFEEEAFSAGDGWITFMPCSVGEEAYELKSLNHGVFSYFLLQGLKGGAKRGEGRVYLEDLKVYLSNSVPQYVKTLFKITQNPQYHCEVKGNIFID